MMILSSQIADLDDLGLWNPSIWMILSSQIADFCGSGWCRSSQISLFAQNWAHFGLRFHGISRGFRSSAQYFWNISDLELWSTQIPDLTSEIHRFGWSDLWNPSIWRIWSSQTPKSLDLSCQIIKSGDLRHPNLLIWRSTSRSPPNDIISEIFLMSWGAESPWDSMDFEQKYVPVFDQKVVSESSQTLISRSPRQKISSDQPQDHLKSSSFLIIFWAQFDHEHSDILL